MEKRIKDVIAEKKNSGLFFSQDWNRTELPLLPREQVIIEPKPQATYNISKIQSNEQIQKRKTRFEPVEIEEDTKPNSRIKEKKTEIKETD